jgi:hypothetical protein
MINVHNARKYILHHIFDFICVSTLKQSNKSNHVCVLTSPWKDDMNLLLSIAGIQWPTIAYIAGHVKPCKLETVSLSHIL